LPLPTEKVSPPKIKQNFSPDSLSELNKILNERDHNVSELWRKALRSGGLEVPAVSVVGGFSGGGEVKVPVVKPVTEPRKSIREHKPPVRLTYYTSTDTNPPPEILPPKTLREVKQSPW